MYTYLIYWKQFNGKQNVFISNIKYIAKNYINKIKHKMYGSEADNIIKASTNLTWLDQYHSRKKIIIEHSRPQNQSLDSHYACRQKSSGSADRTPVLSSIIKTLTSLCHLLWLTHHLLRGPWADQWHILNRRVWCLRTQTQTDATPGHITKACWGSGYEAAAPIDVKNQTDGPKLPQENKQYKGNMKPQ